ncbi:hypothetical protein BGZ93_001238, partial [Podila epicladia]
RHRPGLTALPTLLSLGCVSQHTHDLSQDYFYSANEGMSFLDAGSSGAASSVIAGMDWVAKKASPGKSVIKMSIGGGRSSAINQAAEKLIAKNIFVIAAAGNDPSLSACDHSPAGAADVFAVAALDMNDRTA